MRILKKLLQRRRITKQLLARRILPTYDKHSGEKITYSLYVTSHSLFDEFTGKKITKWPTICLLGSTHSQGICFYSFNFDRHGKSNNII